MGGLPVIEVHPNILGGQALGLNARWHLYGRHLVATRRDGAAVNGADGGAQQGPDTVETTE